MKHIKRPCDECPWRKDSEQGRFTPERWAVLSASSSDGNFGADFDAPLFACHKTPDGKERACAGWLAMEGINHPRVRLDLVTGALPSCAIEPGEDWPELHETFIATRDHDLTVD